jgi:ABC-type sulfate transport system substrate-binding protein
MKSLRPILTVLAILAFSFSSHAKTSVGTLEGMVVDAHGNSIAGATVTMQTSDGQHPHATRSDADGRFAFAHFATGQYDLRAYSRGVYSEWAKRIPIHSQKPTQITLRIVVSQAPAHRSSH